MIVTPYIDPTAGGFILQTALVGLTGVAVVIKLFFSGLFASSIRRFTKPFRRNRSGSSQEIKQG